METIFERVLAAAAEACPTLFAPCSQTADFSCRSDCQTAPDVPGTLFHVDALSYLRNATYTREAEAGSAHNCKASASGQAAPVYTADVGVTWGFKLWDDGSSVRRHMLYNDLRRTCHFSCTIEETTARIWCHTRSGTFVTQGFDIHADARELVQLILFSTFATPHQLGFDPTVRRVVVGCQLHYEVDVAHRDGTHHVYRTVGIEYENPDAGLYSRAMRVFKAVRCDDKAVRGVGEAVQFPCKGKDTHYVALRDYWLSEDARREAEIQDELLGQLKDSMQPGEYEALRRHFLTIVAEDVVAHEKHCRSVHDEYCEDLWKVDDPAKFYFALCQLISILGKFREAGYLHRDISMGNVMLHLFDEKTSGLDRYITKIADLEYARPYERLSTLEPTVGTSLFMAVELQAKKHLWASPLEEDTLTLHYLVHNPLHDVDRRVLEATEWTVMREILQDVEAYSATIFVHSTHGSVERKNLISYARDCQKLGEKLKRLHGDNTVFVKLIDAIGALRATYKAVENSRKATPEERSQLEDDKVNAPRLSINVFHQHAGVYETLRQIFGDISQHFVGGEDSDPLIKISDIDLATGGIVSRPAEPEAPPVTVVDDAASEGGDEVPQDKVGCAPKKLTGKRKNTDEGEVEAGDEGRVFKRHCAKVPAAGD
ncbi:uncharacterized protein SCHCODRAFT_01167403 [Schizophyllum commune H4-8]|uniref:Fungal-type protein kinase domain-containing protein n=1 Tax=Schizophyllum commune (strain H4-8 / FGSC 9210) TaxID=578458 RepID=D8PKQ6_SCHCM|nr:uncharacterized protein SCHCODRAFT_01167403 [Schizophyllum commune H4-8]KAI5897605.1 hypothetical protein SCHCODRAFT_01167403 [Schizophyllum commune H4-8]